MEPPLTNLNPRSKNPGSGLAIGIALQPYGGFIDTLYLYKYVPKTKIFLNRNFL